MESNWESKFQVLVNEVYEQERSSGMSWKLKKSDVEWQRDLLNTLKDGALWVTENATYELNKEKKTLTVKARTNIISDSTANIKRVKRVCKEIGWKVIVPQDLVAGDISNLNITAHNVSVSHGYGSGLYFRKE